MIFIKQKPFKIGMNSGTLYLLGEIGNYFDKKNNLIIIVTFFFKRDKLSEMKRKESSN